VFNWFQGQPCSGEAAFDEAGLVLDLLAVPDDLDQVGEAGPVVRQPGDRDVPGAAAADPMTGVIPRLPRCEDRGVRRRSATGRTRL
jgi:hypothetical protein